MRTVVGLVLVVLAGCVGIPEDEIGSAALGNAPALLNGEPSWGGVYVALDAEQEIQTIEALPCWLRVTYRNGATLWGNYEARGWGEGGLLEVRIAGWQAAPGGSGWPVGGPLARREGHQSLDGSLPALWQMTLLSGELTLFNLRAPGWNDGVSHLRQVSWTEGSQGERWCIGPQQAARRVVERMGDESTWLPAGTSLRPGLFTGVYNAVWPTAEDEAGEAPTDDGIQVARRYRDARGSSTAPLTQVTIGTCYATVCQPWGCFGGQSELIADGDRASPDWAVIDHRPAMPMSVNLGELWSIRSLNVHESEPGQDPIDFEGVLMFGGSGRQRVVLVRDPESPTETLAERWCRHR